MPPKPSVRVVGPAAGRRSALIFATFFFYGLVAVAVLKLKLKRQGRLTGPVRGYPLLQIFLLLFALTLLVNTVVTQPTSRCWGWA